MAIDYFLADVFTKRPFSGNGLAIFPNADKLSKELMQTLTQEMRQFESIFFYQTGENAFRAFIFTMEEELDFAGHPVLGLASLIHEKWYDNQPESTLHIELNTKTVAVTTHKNEGYYSARMNQGTPAFLHTLTKKEEEDFLSYLNLSANDLHKTLTPEVVTTGLPYLILPVTPSALSNVKVTVDDLESKLLSIGAKFVYLLDIENRRGRTWDNAGLVEDIATGSAAGPSGAYLVKNGLEDFNTEIRLSQGEFLNRKSELRVVIKGHGSHFEHAFVEGDVVLIGKGTLY